MIVGILGAVAQSDIKRLLSFTLVSHIGYMLFGIGLVSAAGLAGAIFYVVHHIIIQTTLFLAAGLIERRGGTTTLDRLGGLARLAPVLGVLFFIPALNLAGIPPFSGFLGKLGLLQAGVADGGAARLAAGGRRRADQPAHPLRRSAGCGTWPSGARAATRETPPVETRRPPAGVLPRLMVASTLALVVLGTGLTVIAGPLFDVTAEAAAELLDRAAVRAGRVRARGRHDRTADRGDRPVPARSRWRDRAIAVAVLVTVWMLLWGVFSWANLISGLARRRRRAGRLPAAAGDLRRAAPPARAAALRAAVRHRPGAWPACSWPCWPSGSGTSRAARSSGCRCGCPPTSSSP